MWVLSETCMNIFAKSVYAFCMFYLKHEPTKTLDVTKS